jgi:ceramide glucosyltransferase
MFNMECAVIAAMLIAIQLVSVLLATLRCRRGDGFGAVADEFVGISFIRPLRGVEPHAMETLAASLRQTHPVHEVLFCVADANDPVIPLVEAALRAHPDVDARLLIGADRIGVNPKLNNMVKGWREARYEWVCFADSNLLTPPDYLQRVFATWRPGTGAVSAPPAGADPEDFWGEFECAFLNAHEAKWQYAVDTLGLGFCQGKTLFLNRSVLGDRGLAALADEPAEDAALTRVVRSQGLSARLVGPPFPQPLGPRTARDVWSRQMRWARLRRATFPGFYTLEIMAGFVPPATALAFAASGHGWPTAPVLAALFIVWYGSEALLARVAGWPLTIKSIGASVLRDFSLPILWIGGWVGDGFTWHGASLTASGTPAREVESR